MSLVPLELGPVDVALMVILEQNVPLIERPAMTVGLAGTAVDDIGPLLAFIVGVHPCVEGVLEHGDHVAVADRRPVEGDLLAGLGRPGKVDTLGGHGHQNPTRAAQLAEASEDGTDGLLDPQVGIEAEADQVAGFSSALADVRRLPTGIVTLSQYRRFWGHFGFGSGALTY